MRLSEVESLNLSLVCLRVFASFIGIAGAARTPSVGRRAHAASGCKPEFSQKGPGKRVIEATKLNVETNKEHTKPQQNQNHKAQKSGIATSSEK